MSAQASDATCNLQELQAILHRVGSRVPPFCNPTPSREDWTRLEEIVESLLKEQA